MAELGTTNSRTVIPTTVFIQTADKEVTNTGTETSLVGTGSGSVNVDVSAGRQVDFDMWGTFEEATGTQTITIRIKLGATTITASGAVDPADTSPIGAGMFRIHGTITGRTTGTSGTVISQGVFEVWSDLGYFSERLDNSTTDTVNNSGVLALDITADWNNAVEVDTIKSTNFSIIQK